MSPTQLKAQFEAWIRKELGNSGLRASIQRLEVEGGPWRQLIADEAVLNMNELLLDRCHPKLRRDSALSIRRTLKILSRSEPSVHAVNRVMLVNDLRAARRAPFLSAAVVPGFAVEPLGSSSSSTELDLAARAIVKPFRDALKQTFAGNVSAPQALAELIEPLSQSEDGHYWRFAQDFLIALKGQTLRPAHRALLRHMNSRLKALLEREDAATLIELQDLALYGNPTLCDPDAVVQGLRSGQIKDSRIAAVHDLTLPIGALSEPETAADTGEGHGQSAASASHSSPAKPEALGPITPVAPEPTQDQEILLIFIEEAEELQDAIAENLQTMEDGDTPAALAELKRLLHTVKGSARMASQDALGELAHSWESRIDLITDDITASELAEHYRWFDAICASIDALRDFANGREPGVKVAAAPEVENQADVVTQSVPDTSPRRAAQDPLPPDERIPQTVAPKPIDDPELLDIFTEEAEELMEALEAAIDGFLASPDDIDEHGADIKRVLHTLKGSARMAGQEPLGDLAHDFESLFEPLPTAADAAFQATLHHWLDALAASVVALKTGGEPEPIATTLPNSGMLADRPLAEAEIPVLQSRESQAPISDAHTRPQQDAQSVRVSEELLDALLQDVGENAIGVGRLDEHVDDIASSLLDMQLIHTRLVKKLAALSEAPSEERAQRARAMLEQTDNELVIVTRALDEKLGDARRTMSAQRELMGRLRNNVLSTRMVPFSRLMPRLRRMLRQIAAELNKQVQLQAFGTEVELERVVLDALLPAMEHMFRNALDHGIEDSHTRVNQGKSPRGLITLTLARVGGDVLISLQDDGRGIDLERVAIKARERGLMTEADSVSDSDLRQLIFHPGFSTAEQLSQLSGRGVGMDVVLNDITALGGSVRVNDAKPGTEFVIRLPQTGSVCRAILVCAGDHIYAIPANALEGVITVNPFELEAAFDEPSPKLHYAGAEYQLNFLGQLLGLSAGPVFDGYDTERVVVLVHAFGDTGSTSTALLVDSLIGGKSIVIEALGKEFANVAGISGATVAEGGEVVLVLDVPALIEASQIGEVHTCWAKTGERVPVVMAVDDSATSRKTTQRLLQEHNLPSFAARDGVEALARLNSMQQLPDLILLDVEMPRMNGFEFAQALRSDERFANIPVIMLSALADAERKEMAISLGAREFLSKSCSKAELMSAIDAHLFGANL